MAERKTTKIEIPEITRVEGHEAVYVDIEDDRVVDVRLDVFEGARFFEKLVEGNSYKEMPHITSRVCAICSTGHVIAAIRALEKIASFKPDHTTELLRELMHLGMIIESNATHLYALALPDFKGFKDVYQFATEYATEFGIWTELRNTGATIQTTIGGRPFHPVNLHAGGFSKYPSLNDLELIESKIRSQIQNAMTTAEMFLGFEPPVKRTSTPAFLALIPEGEHYGYFGDRVKSSTGFEADVQDYREYLDEETVSHSHAKRSTFEGKPLMVGSLARLTLFFDRLKNRARGLYDASPLAKGETNSILNNLGQAIEIVEAVDRALEITRELIVSFPQWHLSKSRQDLKPILEEGDRESIRAVGTVECPRGTLYHEFTVDKKGLIKAANMITPSAQNTYRIEMDIREVVEECLKAEKIANKNEKDIQSILNKNLETLVRAYDPCNTCATHMVEVRYQKGKD